MLSLVACVLASFVQAAPSTQPTRPGWTLTWHDEFDGPEVDTSKWELITKRDNYNKEQQYYLPEQARIVDGMLRITATNEPKDGKPFRSARLEAIYTQQYGRFECRAKVVKGQGMWPAFWILPRPTDWPRKGEIDILESKGSNTNWLVFSYHFLDPDTKKHRYVHREIEPKTADGKPIDFAEDFHTYAVEWEPGEIRWYLDDSATPIYRATKDDAPISEHPMHCILNLAVGGNFNGDADQTTKFPAQFDVDWVRVWKQN